MRLKFLIFGWIATMLLGVSDANASILTLYDGSSGVTPAGFTPQQLNFFSVAGGTETYRPAEQATELQTTTVQYAGYSNFTPAGALVNANFPLLDRLAGYQIKFTCYACGHSVVQCFTDFVKLTLHVGVGVKI